MYKCIVLLAALCAVVYARPHKWQMLKPVPGYIPVYIQHGDEPLEEINLELAEAFHAIPSGRSASRDMLAEDKDSNIEEESIDEPLQPKDLEDNRKRIKETPSSDNFLLEEAEDKKRIHSKKTKKVTSEHIQKIHPASDDI